MSEAVVDLGEVFCHTPSVRKKHDGEEQQQRHGPREQ